MKWQLLEAEVEERERKLRAMETRLAEMESEAEAQAHRRLVMHEFVADGAGAAPGGRNLGRAAVPTHHIKISKELELKKLVPPAVMGEQSVLIHGPCQG